MQQCGYILPDLIKVFIKSVFQSLNIQHGWD